MEYLLYIMFGFLDLLSIQAIIFKLFRFPFWKNFKKIALVCIILVIVSIIMRLVLHLAEYDMGMQFVLCVLLYRYFLRFRVFESLTLATVGFLFFDLIQLIVIFVLLHLDFASTTDIGNNTGLGTYAIQLGTDFSIYLFSWLLYKFHLGFSFIMSPPHDLTRGTKMVGENILMFIAVICGTLVILLTLLFLFNYYNHVGIIFLVVVAVLTLMMFVSNQKDLSDV